MLNHYIYIACDAKYNQKTHLPTLRAEHNTASEEVLHINTQFNLLKFEIIFQSSPKVREFARNTVKILKWCCLFMTLEK